MVLSHRLYRWYYHIGGIITPSGYIGYIGGIITPTGYIGGIITPSGYIGGITHPQVI